MPKPIEDRLKVYWDLLEKVSAKEKKRWISEEEDFYSEENLEDAIKELQEVLESKEDIEKKDE